MANFVRQQSEVCVNCKDCEVIDVPRCFYTRYVYVLTHDLNMTLVNKITSLHTLWFHETLA